MKIWWGVMSLSIMLFNHAICAGCSSTNITITNTTPHLCVLSESEMKHGYFDFVSSAPVYIPANSTSAPFILSQSFNGSELILKYTCGADHSITIDNKHNYRIFLTGKVSTAVIEAQNMVANNRTALGSCFWNEHASIQWIFSY